MTTGGARGAVAPTAPSPAPLLLVSDVDGTLLDDRGQLPVSPATLRAALAALARTRGTPVYFALASSRTVRELVVLQRALGVRGPLIAEDGGVLALDVDDMRRAPHDAARDRERDPEHDVEREIVRFGRRPLVCEPLAPRAAALRQVLRSDEALAPLLAADAAAQGTSQQEALGFRSRGARRRALVSRHYSLLVDPTPLDGATLARARTACAAHGLHCLRGGRWLTVSGAAGKGAALMHLRNHLAMCDVSPTIAAIGNEENDRSLLAAADVAFVIDNPGRGPHPALAGIAGAIILQVPGTGGWMDMLTRLTTRAPEHD
ncbi:MAG: HAD hydrolase family protein [Gemmatimonadetes bacterium]|nr:HAD hydrolase family protein [Gemmatimonadota bacterium]